MLRYRCRCSLNDETRVACNRARVRTKGAPINVRECQFGGMFHRCGQRPWRHGALSDYQGNRPGIRWNKRTLDHEQAPHCNAARCGRDCRCAACVCDAPPFERAVGDHIERRIQACQAASPQTQAHASPSSRSQAGALSIEAHPTNKEIS